MNPLIFEQGKLHRGLVYEAYAAMEGFRSSWLYPLKRSPAHFKADQTNPRESTQALEFGKLWHSLVENGEKFMDLAKVEPVFQGYTQKGELTTSPNCKAVKEAREYWRAGLTKDAIIVKQEDFVTLTGMLQSMSSHKVVRNMIKEGLRETSASATCPETGLVLKFRPDLITSRGHIVDHKTTRDARYWYFYNQIFSDKGQNRFYVLSAAHYSYCAKLLGLPQYNAFTYIAIEKTPPYGINVFPLDEGALDVGERHRSKLMRVYKTCVETDVWPSYDEVVHPVYPPEWRDEHNMDTGSLYDEEEEI